MLIIPFTTHPKKFQKVEVDGATIRMIFHWNSNSQAWYMDIEGITFDLIIRGLRCCTGIKLLEPFAIREIGDLVIVDLEDEDKEPDYESFGVRHQIVYLTKEELGYDIV